MVLGTRNSKWLNVSMKRVYPIILVGVLVLIGKFLFAGPSLDGTLPFDERAVNLGYRIGCVLLFLWWKIVLTKPYQQHVMTEGEDEPLLITAIIWSVIGRVIEMVFITGFKVLI
ncbi:hypothetical protein [Bacillus sp. 2205SS5-2]|uniref:hypothetical protein n=1 Tax=Bacillus sp. 2205SS5-2 TaxID=3109031 RepID=UPI00300718B1